MRAIFNSKIGIFIVLMFLSFFSCSSKKNRAGFSHGEIVYSVDMDDFNSSYSMICPESFRLKYSSRGFALESSVLMGLMDAKIMHKYSSSMVDMLMGVYGNGKYTNFDMTKISGKMKLMSFNDIRTKEKVMGYKCKCKEYSNPAKNIRLRMYYSDSFDSKISDAIFPGIEIEGMVLKLILESKDGRLVVEAKEFSDKAVGNATFGIPSSYTKTSMEEIMSIIRDMSK